MSNFLLSIFDGIPSKIEKNRVQNSINEQKKRFDKGLVSEFENHDEYLRGTPHYKQLDKVLKGIKGYRGQPFNFIISIAKERIKNNDKLLKLADDVFTGKIDKQLITYDKMHIITYVSICDWFLDYAVSWLHVTTNELAGEAEANPYNDPMNKERLALLDSQGNAKTFRVICETLSKDFGDILEVIEAMEGITFDPDNVAVTAKQFKPEMTNIASSGFISTHINPFYWLGQLENLWVKYRYDQLKEDNAALQMKVYRLERLKAGIPEDSDEIKEINEQIEYHLNRIAKIKTKLEEYEND